jgi:glyoxylase-like metal-dependent hydrolase (beta-lactamase superfamily II)
MVKVFNFEDNPNEFSANTYVIGKIGMKCLIVDIGSTRDDIISYIEKHYEGVAGILLTHAHFDHIRGLPKILKRFKNVPVYLASEDVPLLNNPSINSSNMTGERISVNVDTVPVEDGETVEVHNSFHFKVIKTPFHTQGSVCYLFEDDNALFTGDTLFRGSIGRTDLETSNPGLVKDSLKKLGALSDYLVVYPGHGSISRLGVEKETNPYFVEALQ